MGLAERRHQGIHLGGGKPLQFLPNGCPVGKVLGAERSQPMHNGVMISTMNHLIQLLSLMMFYPIG